MSDRTHPEIGGFTRPTYSFHQNVFKKQKAQPQVKSNQKSKNHQRRIFLDNYYRQRCLVLNLVTVVILRLNVY
jgi:hypothetical protein